MDGARAAVAGILATGLVLVLVFPSDQLREPERAFAAFALLVVIIGLLVGADMVGAIRGGRKDDEEGD